MESGNRQEVVSDGNLSLLLVSVPYFNRSEITVFFNDVAVPPEDGRWAWVGQYSTVISLNPAPVAGTVIAVVRSTDAGTPHHKFSQGAQFNPKNLDENFEQVLRVVQEQRNNTVQQAMFGNLNMNGFRLLNLADGTLPGHATTKRQFDAFLATTGTLVNRATLGANTGATLVGTANGNNLQQQLDLMYGGIVNVCDKKYAGGADKTGVRDSTAAFKAAVADMAPGKTFYVPHGSSYKLTDTIEFFNLPRCNFYFNGQYLNMAGFTSPKVGLHFKGISQSRIDDIFIIGHNSNTTVGAYFDADAANISIHCNVGKIYTANCVVGTMIGSSLGWQLDDWYVQDIYASDCVRGIVITGENTLAMAFGRVAAYHCTSIGVHLEQGSGVIQSLQVADAPFCLYLGQTDGKNHNKLNRWDITAGYSEEGQPGEVFIASAACTDSRPFREQITIRGMRVTPFTITGILDFIRFRLNGDLIFAESTITGGTQPMYFSLDHNGAYRAPRVYVRDAVIDINPGGPPDLGVQYMLSDNRQYVEMNAKMNNCASPWNNSGVAGFGVITQGVDTRKLRTFESALLRVGGLAAAWNLRDISSNSSRSLMGGPNLNASATVERRDVWMDDGLLGVLQNATTAKLFTAAGPALATTAAGATFGCILRPLSTGGSQENATTYGGDTAMRLAMYDAGGGVGLCLVGGSNAFIPITNPYDAHMLIGRYLSETHIKLDSINLRTGEVQKGQLTVGVPAIGSITWDTIVQFSNVHTARAFPFVYKVSISDSETVGLLQAGLQLTDDWR